MRVLEVLWRYWVIYGGIEEICWVSNLGNDKFLIEGILIEMIMKWRMK